ncbi:MAG: hypothetical protein COX41_05810, partial [Candidatus Omnitrophica bacterium CG23_combo_of_CG06-09_8_20_14_all_41_10]
MKAAKFLGVVFLAGILLAQFSMVAFAEYNDVELEKIIVTPYRTAVSIDQGAASVDVISASSALSEGKFSLTDALKDLSSVDYTTSGGAAGDTSFYIRGANPEHTQVLLDGIKLYDPISTSGYFYAYNYMGFD